MKTVTVSFDELKEIAQDAELRIAYDFVKGIAYLRRGQVRYVADLEAVSA